MGCFYFNADMGGVCDVVFWLKGDRLNANIFLFKGLTIEINSDII